MCAGVEYAIFLCIFLSILPISLAGTCFSLTAALGLICIGVAYLNGRLAYITWSKLEFACARWDMFFALNRLFVSFCFTASAAAAAVYEDCCES